MNSPGLFLLCLCLVAKYEVQALTKSKTIVPQSKNDYSETKPKLIVCYYVSWGTDRIDGNPCTHIIYSFVSVNADGTIPEMPQKEKGKKIYRKEIAYLELA